MNFISKYSYIFIWLYPIDMADCDHVALSIDGDFLYYNFDRFMQPFCRIHPTELMKSLPCSSKIQDLSRDSAGVKSLGYFSIFLDYSHSGEPLPSLDKIWSPHLFDTMAVSCSKLNDYKTNKLDNCHSLYKKPTHIFMTNGLDQMHMAMLLTEIKEYSSKKKDLLFIGNPSGTVMHDSSYVSTLLVLKILLAGLEGKEGICYTKAQLVLQDLYERKDLDLSILVSYLNTVMPNTRLISWEDFYTRAMGRESVAEHLVYRDIHYPTYLRLRFRPEPTIENAIFKIEQLSVQYAERQLQWIYQNPYFLSTMYSKKPADCFRGFGRMPALRVSSCLAKDIQPEQPFITFFKLWFFVWFKSSSDKRRRMAICFDGDFTLFDPQAILESYICSYLPEALFTDSSQKRLQSYNYFSTRDMTLDPLRSNYQPYSWHIVDDIIDMERPPSLIFHFPIRVDQIDKYQRHLLTIEKKMQNPIAKPYSEVLDIHYYVHDYLADLSSGHTFSSMQYKELINSPYYKQYVDAFYQQVWDLFYVSKINVNSFIRTPSQLMDDISVSAQYLLRHIPEYAQYALFDSIVDDTMWVDNFRASSVSIERHNLKMASNELYPYFINTYFYYRQYMYGFSTYT